jgi:hypothetical protein
MAWTCSYNQGGVDQSVVAVQGSPWCPPHYIHRIRETINIYRILVGKPHGRPEWRWEDKH